MKDEIAGNLKEKVAPKEDSRCESELLTGDRQLAIHRQRRKPQVDSVDEGDDVEDKEKREQSDPELPDRRGLDQVRNNATAGCHTYLSHELVRVPRNCPRRSPGRHAATLQRQLILPIPHNPARICIAA